MFKGAIKAPHQAIISGKFDGELGARDVLIDASGVVTGRVRGTVTEGEIERGDQVKGDMIQR